MTMTDDEIARLRGLLEKATPGPWEPMKGVSPTDEMRCAVLAIRGDFRYLVATIENGAPGDFCDTEYANATLIVAAVNALPALLAERDALKGQVEAMREALEEISHGVGEFSRDPYEHACNVIEEAKRIAKAALAAAGAKGV